MTEVHYELLTDSQIYNSPYRSENLSEEIGEIFENYLEFLNRTFGDSRSGWYFTAFFFIIIFGTIKSIVHIIENYSKPKFNPKEVYKLDRQVTFTGLNYSAEQREKYNSLQDQYAKSRETKASKAKVLNALRMHLYLNDLKLEGKILKVTQHKITDLDVAEFAKTGNISKRLSTTQITFGNEINELLSQALPNYVTLRKKKFSNETYIIAENDDYGFIQEKLKNLYQEEIKVTFD
jgi:hypothetical protein